MLFSIETNRLTLRPASEEDLLLLIAGREEFRSATGIAVAEGYLEFPEALRFTLDKLESLEPHEAQWWTPYLFIHKADSALMGLGGYKGPPAEGAVELGYGVAHAYRNQGIATEATRALMARAWEAPGVDRVLAHTLGQPNASTRVLEKAGFTRIAEFEDPDDGLLWQWEIRK